MTASAVQNSSSRLEKIGKIEITLCVFFLVAFVFPPGLIRFRQVRFGDLKCQLFVWTSPKVKSLKGYLWVSLGMGTAWNSLSPVA